MSIAVVVSSYDGFQPTWEPFCHGFSKYWPDCPWPLYFITNELDSPCGRPLKIREETNWTRMTRAVLTALRESVVLWIHDDCWLSATADTKTLARFASYVLRDGVNLLRLCGTQMSDARGPWQKDKRLLVLRDPTRQRTSLAPTFWRVETFLRVLGEAESPWQFEGEGALRSRGIGGFLCLAPRVLPLKYVSHVIPGWGNEPVVRRRWTEAAVRYLEREELSLKVKPGELVTEMIITSKDGAARRWSEIRGDDSLRVDYDLDADSIVFDIGGYLGKWTGRIFSRYGCTVHVFEPVLEFADEMERRFAGAEKVHVHRFGLGHANQTRPISVMRDSSSFYRKVGESRDAREVCALDFILGNQIEMIDLMEVNIEGGEYDLLNHLIGSGLMPTIRNIQIQFHDFIPGAERRLTELQEGLGETHDLVFQFPFIWEGWRIKDG